MEWMSDWFPEPLIQRIKENFADESKERDWNMRSTLLLQDLKQALCNHRPDSEEVQQISSSNLWLSLTN